MTKDTECGERNNFVCAICQRDVDMRWSFSVRAHTSFAPICFSCERWYSGRVGKPDGGSFRDRREVQRGVAIAEALRTEAMRQTWSETHAYA